MDADRRSVEVAPLQAEGSLEGFLISGRWPRDPVEWSKFLVLAVRVAAVPGLLPTTTVFCIREEIPQDSSPGTVGLVIAVGQLLGDDPLKPGQFARPQPPGLVVLHPPAHTLSSVPDYEVASGCVLLPGVPHLGLDHRAAWAAADIRGTVTELHTRCGVNPHADADTAALAMLLAA